MLTRKCPTWGMLALLALQAAGPARADDAGTTTIGSQIFADFTYINQKSNGATTDATGAGTDVKRAFLIVNHTFDSVWSANITTDFNYSSSTNSAEVFVRRAYLQATLSKAFTAQLGSATLPWVPYAESFYGYQYVEEVLVGRLNFGTTDDWGLHASGKLADDQVNYQLSVVNGNGFRNPSRSKTVDVEGRIGYAPIPEVTISGGFYSGKRGQETESRSVANTATRFDAMATFVNSTWRFGAEYFYAKDWGAGTAGSTEPDALEVLIDPHTDKAEAYSLWGVYNFLPSWSAIARVDYAKPSKDLNPNLNDTYFNVGLAWHATKDIDLTFAVKHEQVNHGTIESLNGNITKTPTGGFDGLIGGTNNGTYTEGGMWVLVNF
jgi:hypothetical protein